MTEPKQQSQKNADSAEQVSFWETMKTVDAYDQLTAPIMLADSTNVIRYLNPAAENILGVSAKRASGESFLQLVDDEPELRDILSRSIQTGDTYANELRLAPNEATAHERIVDCRVSPIHCDGAALLVGALSGSQNPLQPLNR